MLAAIDLGSTKLKVTLARADLTEMFHCELRYTDTYAVPFRDASQWTQEAFLTNLGALLSYVCLRHGFGLSVITTLCISATAPDFQFHLSPTSIAVPELTRSFSDAPQITASELTAIQRAYPNSTPWSQEFIIRARQFDKTPLDPKRPIYYHTKHSWIFSILTGEYALDHPTASELGLAYDRSTRDWNRRVIQSELAANVELPALRMPGIHRRQITIEASATSGLGPDVIVALGACDSFCTILDAGCFEPGDVLVYYGTFFCSALTNIKGYFESGDEFGAGFEWIFSLPFAGKTVESLVSELYQADPDAAFAMFEIEARGMSGLPIELSNHSEFPFIWDPARFALPLVCSNEQRAPVVIGIMDCIGRNLREKLAATSGISAIFATGGGTKSPIWLSSVGGAQITQRLASERSGAVGTLILSTFGASPKEALPFIMNRRERSATV